LEERKIERKHRQEHWKKETLKERKETDKPRKIRERQTKKETRLKPNKVRKDELNPRLPRRQTKEKTENGIWKKLDRKRKQEQMRLKYRRQR